MIKEEYEHLRLGCACTMLVESLHHKLEQNTAKLIVIMIKVECEHLRPAPGQLNHCITRPMAAEYCIADSNHD